MIRAVLFDLFETLITESRVPPTRASSLGGALGLDPKAFRVEWKARRPLVLVGELSFAAALIEISLRLAGRVDAAAVQRACEQRLQEKALAFAAVEEEVGALIGELRGQHLALAVVSNCFAEDVHAWPTWPLARDFQCSVFSCAAGVAKPDPEIYLRATRGLRVEPATAVFIGDGADGELAGAERAGLRAFCADWFAGGRRRVRSSTGDAVALASCQDVLKLVAAG